MTTRRTVLLGGLSLAGLAACTSQEPSQTASAPTSQTPGGSPATSAPASSPAPSTSAPPSSTTPSTTTASSLGPTALSIGTPTDLVTGLTTPWGLRAIDDDT